MYIPMTYKEKTNKVLDYFEELFPAEKKTAQYILDHLEEVILLNISQLAKKAHASEASIVRMAKYLGYNGFFQMRLLLSNDVA